MIVNYKSKVSYFENSKNLEFEDTYHIDITKFENHNQILEFIKNDLLLVINLNGNLHARNNVQFTFEQI